MQHNEEYLKMTGMIQTNAAPETAAQRKVSDEKAEAEAALKLALEKAQSATSADVKKVKLSAELGDGARPPVPGRVPRARAAFLRRPAVC